MFTLKQYSRPQKLYVHYSNIASRHTCTSIKKYTSNIEISKPEKTCTFTKLNKSWKINIEK